MIWLIITGYAAYLTTHLLWLGKIPGLHFDEAWAANFSYGISSGQQLHVLHAMSPYTAPWSHFIAALFFRLFGTNLFVYRCSGVITTFIGMVFIDLALWESGKKKAAVLLPWIFGFFIPLLLNHRFSIEINTFHPFCFGLLFYGLYSAQKTANQKKKYIQPFALIAISILLGITSHILFLAPVLGLLITLGLCKKSIQSETRTLIASIAAIQLPFFISILFSIPEKDKALALVLINLAILIWALVFKCKIPFSSKLQKKMILLLATLSIPSFFFLVFFSEGHWSEFFHFGHLNSTFWISSSLILWGATLFIFKKRGFKKSLLTVAPQEFWVWMMSTLFLIGCLMLKPTPRYFEVGFIFLGISFSLLIASLSPILLRTIALVFVLWSSVQLENEYFQTGLRGLAQEKVFGFFFLKDRSTDNLSKQDLVTYLASRGCTYQDVSTSDPRIGEALKFLALGDWSIPKNAKCALKNVSIYRKAESPAPTQSHSLFFIEDFAIETLSDSCNPIHSVR